MTDARSCRVFIGSSTEGTDQARALQQELLPDCEPIMWGQGVFEPGGYTLDSLIAEAHKCDFAVLVATPDDIRERRGETGAVPRDNVILEFGLFAGVLGRDRTYVLSVGGVSLPTDTLGLTRLAYHDTQSIQRLAVSEAADQVRGRIRAVGGRQARAAALSNGSEMSALEAELAELVKDAQSQGWTVKDSPTALRLTSPKGRTHTMSKSTTAQTRTQLRPFAAKLRAGGLRVDGAVRRPPEESPFS